MTAAQTNKAKLK